MIAVNSSRRIARPTEHAAIRAVCRSPRPALTPQTILADMVTANRAEDRYGIRLCAQLLVRATTSDVEQ